MLTLDPEVREVELALTYHVELEFGEGVGGAPSYGDAVLFLQKPSTSWRREKSFLLVRNKLVIKREAFSNPEKGNAINVCHLSYTSNRVVVVQVARCMEHRSRASLPSSTTV